MFTSDLLLGGQLWLVSLIFGFISLPFSIKFFPNLSDKGYFLGKLIALFVISYSLFLLATLKVLPLGLISPTLLAVVWGVINLFIWKKDKKLDLPWKMVLFEEIIFLCLLSLFIFIKGHQPEIYQIERFMDYGFIKALTQSEFLPLEDIWKAGEHTNYYYFGHFIAYVLIVLSKVGSVAGFMLVQCWVFASAGVLAFVAGTSVLKNWKVPLKWAAFGGFLSLFATIFAGDWQTFNWYINKFLFEVFNVGSMPSFWYPDPTRIIKGTISELPIYSFLVADLHAHVWGFLLGAVIITILVSLWFQKEKIFLVFPLLSFLLGLAIMINTWDFLTLGSIVFLTLFLKLKEQKLVRRIIFIAPVFIFALVVSLPWLIFFKSPLGGIGIVTKDWSNIVSWLLFWGPSVFLILIYFLVKIKTKLDFNKDGLIIILFFTSILWLAFLEIFYIKDILSGGEWFRANTYFKVSLQVLLWVGIITGPAIFSILRNTNKPLKLVLAAIFSIWLLTRVVYPIKAINQSSLEGKDYTGISSGLSFWQNKYPEEFEAFQFLETKPKGVILEADGDSYEDTSFFSSILGWPTVSGWAVHEWTWRGSYDEVGSRAGEVREVYTGENIDTAKEILNKYKVKYIVVSQAEKRKYESGLKPEKLEVLGKIIFQNNQTTIFQLPLN